MQNMSRKRQGMSEVSILLSHIKHLFSHWPYILTHTLFVYTSESCPCCPSNLSTALSLLQLDLSPFLTSSV